MSNSVALRSGARFAWDEQGEGDPLVLLHGLGGWGWHSSLPLLGERYRAIAPYLRGFGESTGDLDYRMEDLAGDLVEFITTTELGPVPIVGHSLGAMVAQVMGTDHPQLVKSLVLASTKSHTGKRAAKFGEVMAVISELGEEAVLSDPVLSQRLTAVVVETFPDAPPPLELLARGVTPSAAAAAGWRCSAAFSRWARLSEIRSPVMVIHGSADILIPPKLGRWTHEAIAGSRYIEIQNGGHSIQTTHARSFVKEILDFLAEVAARESV